MVARAPTREVARAFAAIEDALIVLLQEHGGRLMSRLTDEPGLLEAHVVTFPSLSCFNAYVQDPRRSRHTYFLSTLPMDRFSCRVYELAGEERVPTQPVEKALAAVPHWSETTVGTSSSCG